MVTVSTVIIKPLDKRGLMVLFQHQEKCTITTLDVD